MFICTFNQISKCKSYLGELLKMVKKRVSFDIEEDIKLQVKQLALDKKTTATELYTKFIVDGLKRETEQARLD